MSFRWHSSNGASGTSYHISLVLEIIPDEIIFLGIVVANTKLFLPQMPADRRSGGRTAVFLQVRVTKDLGVAVSVPSFFVNPRFVTDFLARGTMGVDGPALDRSFL